MKRKFKRGCRGAISVFLVIIFMAQFVFCGLLVDASRQKMAEAMAESALDSASTSVLSYYNKLLFDLYGLMGTDSLTEDKVNEMLKSYVEKTLGLASADPASVKGLVSSVMDAFQTAAKSDLEASTLDGYDFQISVSGSPAVTLASTDFVEYQLIEHMKYRAPIYMLNTDDGFLSKLQGLVDIKDRIKAASDRLTVTNDHAATGKAAANTMSGVNNFSQKVRGYLNDPDADTIGSAEGAVSVANVIQFATNFDSRIDDIIKEYKDRQFDYEDALESYGAEVAAYHEAAAADPSYTGSPPTPPEAPEPWSAVEWKEALSGDFDTMKKSYNAVIDNAEKLKIDAETYINEIDTGVGNYKRYIADLNQACTDNGGADNANAATVFLPEVELAEANAGQLLKNRPFLTCVTTFTGDIIDVRSNLNARMDVYLTEIATQLSNNVDSSDPPYTSMKERLSPHLSNMTGGLKQLEFALSDALIVQPAQVDVGTSVDVSKAKEDVKEENPGNDLRNINEDSLKVEFQPSTAVDPADFNLDSTNADPSKLLNAASNLVDVLLGYLEGARDSLYLSQYVTHYFPNYVDNYKATDKAGDATKKFNDGGLYAPYCASQAEVEYVLTGQADGKLNILEVQAMLLGIRTTFNLIAIFTDSAKISQANAMAAAISGPFAPIVSIALLVGWAIAESVMDVNELCKGNTVALFKQGSDWFFSAEGAVKKAISAGVDYLSDEIADQVSNLATSITGQVKNAADQAVYKAYDATTSSLDSGIEAAKGTINAWTNNMTDSLSGSPEVGAGELSTAVSSIQNELVTKMGQGVSDKIKNGLGGVKNEAILQISKATEKADTVIKEKIDSLSGKVSEKLASSLSSWVSDKIPVGEVVSLEKGGASKKENSSVKLSYMDYIQIFLLLKSNEKKTQRIQELIQANLCYKETGSSDESGTFRMKDVYGALTVELQGSIKYLFMSEAFVPADLRRDGRLSFTVHSSVSY